MQDFHESKYRGRYEQKYGKKKAFWRAKAKRVLTECLAVIFNYLFCPRKARSREEKAIVLLK